MDSRRFKDFGTVKELTLSPEEGPATMVSRLLEQIGVLKTKNETLLGEHQESLRKYEEKLSKHRRELASLTKDNVSLREQLQNRPKDCHLSKAEFLIDLNAKVEVEVAQLQRRVQELDSNRMKEKTLHTTELEQMKLNLGQSQKALADQTKAVDTLQKQLNTAENKIKDLRKTAVADQVEIRSLRSKAQGADEHRTLALARNQEMEQLKRTIRQLEAKHKSEIHDLTSKLQIEIKNHASQTKQQDGCQEKLRNQLHATEQDLKSVRQELNLAIERNQGTKHDLHLAREELCGFRDLIPRVTQAYSILANNSIPSTKYDQMENMYLSTRFRLFRLERRLADREIIIEQLTDFCKQLSEEKLATKKFLEDMDVDFRRATLDLSDVADDFRDMAFLVDTANIHMAHLQEENHLKQTECDVLVHLQKLREEHSSDLLTAYTISDIESSKLTALQNCVVSHGSRMVEEISRVNTERNRIAEESWAKSKQITESEAKLAVLSTRLTSQQEELTTLEAASKKHLQNSQRLAQILYHSQKKEQHLEGEIARLSDDIEDALRYKEAHADLLSEVVDLIQRNELAEAEAERLSKFNAEILGHKNPQQKIYYMDRVRSELAEAKHEILRSTREREVLAVSAASLQSELALYKSIAVPIEHKPIGSRVRVERVGLHSLDLNRLSPESFQNTQSEN